MRTIMSFLLIVSFFKVDVMYSGKPDYSNVLPGDYKYISRYDPVQHRWLDHRIEQDNFALFNRFDPIIAKAETIPEKKKVEIKLNPSLWYQKDRFDFQTVMACAVMQNRKFKLINVERSINELGRPSIESRVWPHLGLLYVGTVADQEGWGVSLYDELIEHYVDLEKFIQPGDVVGLSLVSTGMERGIELARQAKRLGASYCIAGNDSAIFRANQILKLPDHPIDAVFTTNSLTAVRQFLRQVGSVEIQKLNIPGVAVVPTNVNLSNERSVILAEQQMRNQLKLQGTFDSQDVFVVPKLSLFRDGYWQTVWKNYRTIFGHKHKNSAEVKNAISLFAQGCTRTGSADVCSYCTIAGVADMRTPTDEYLKQLLETYRSFGINYVYNATDSAFEMRNVLNSLVNLNASFPEGLIVYGRTWGLAHHPELIDRWLSLTGGRLLVNCGLDSGDEDMLSRGIIKASQKGSRLDENRLAVENIAKSGVHLHCSLIFGSPGETKESCEKSLAFLDWTHKKLGSQLDQCESDFYWLNHGSPASRVFHDFGYAKELAAIAGKEISRETWENSFHRHRDTLVVPEECEKAWYDCFTSISVEDAQKYNGLVAKAMSEHQGAAPGRLLMAKAAFKPS